MLVGRRISLVFDIMFFYCLHILKKASVAVLLLMSVTVCL